MNKKNKCVRGRLIKKEVNSSATKISPLYITSKSNLKWPENMTVVFFF